MIKGLIRTVIIYFVIMIVMRLLGKRQLGQLQVSEFVSTLLISEIAAAPITEGNLSLWHAIIPIAVIFTLEMLIPSILYKHPTLRKYVEGTPSFLIEDGNFCIKEIKKNKLSPEELLSVLRTNGITDPSEVEYAILEPSGAISIFQKDNYKPASKGDLNGSSSGGSGISRGVILQGKFNRSTFKKLKLNDKKLASILRKNKISADKVYLMTMDDSGKVTIIPKD